MDKKVIVDCHVHVTPDGGWFGTHINASLDRFLKELDASSVQKALLLPVGKDDTELREATEFVVELTRSEPHRLMGLSAYYPGLTIEEVLENNLVGIKIHPRQNKIDILDEELFFLYKSAMQEGLPILFDSYCTPISDMPLEKIRPLAYRELAAKFPSLKIILAHSGMPFIWETYLVLKWYNNIFADLSHILLYFQNTSLISDLAWVLRKIPQKFIYGSDFPEVGLSEYFQEFEKFCRHHHVPSEIILSNFNTVIRQSL
jgi:predicted TIM-barrel fold metal-dependent hydrolase